MSTLQSLQNHFPNLDFQSEVPLAPFTYMRIGGPAEIFWKAQNLDQLRDVVSFAFKQKIKLSILGGASNVVVRDGGIRGLVILNACDSVDVFPSWAQLDSKLAQHLPQQSKEMAENKIILIAESGIKTALLVRRSVDEGLTGLEPFLGVPGTLGGAVFNNSHYTTELIGNYIAAVEAVTTEGESVWYSQSECDFAYDHSRFHHSGEIILRAFFVLDKGESASSMSKISEATIKRASTQPLGTANSGCMFQNVVLTPDQQDRFGGKTVLSAGWLIDQAGLKGMRVGKAVVSDKHANFVINEGGASFAEVEELVHRVQQEVERQFGVKLEPEVFFVGENGKGS